MSKRVLVVGQGGREHALVWKLAQSPEVKKVYSAPGNPGIAELAECVDIAANDIEKLVAFAKEKDISLTVVGPEVPLMEGIADRFQQENLLVFGPTKEAARLEGSKVFSKDLFKKYGIPTASYETFCSPYEARVYARFFTDEGKSIVIKADGLAAGKGVIIANTFEEADQAIESIMKDKQFGSAGDRIVVEEFLEGEELSFFAISDGTNFVSIMAAQDHKRVFDFDEGPNTGGMGAYVNPPVYTDTLKEQIIREVIQPTIHAMQQEGCPYQGVLYAGLMLTEEGPKVLEYNARFGDPETQVLMPMIEGDLFPILEAAAVGDLTNTEVGVKSGSCVCVVLASGGYPGPFEKGKEIQGLQSLESDILVFQAGTCEKDGKLLTNGGRVLAVVAGGETIKSATERVYREVEKVHFDGMHYRRDIARRALN
ncbi:MAG: phosphoribosylamine--glycine ligase [Bacillota bacterium]|nr:phosphoribosylamine--glycine ligase [Bacillota bacterium]